MIRSLLTILLFASLQSCQEGYRPVNENHREKDANIRINNFIRQSVTPEGKTEWILKAEESYLFRKNQAESRISVYGFEFLQYDTKGKRTGRLTADRGEVNYEEQKLHLTGNVVFLDDSGRTITAPNMDYDMETKILTSDDAVKILENNLTTICRKGIVVEKEKNRQVCRFPSGEHRQTPGSKVDDIFQ